MIEPKSKENQIWGDHLNVSPNETNISFCAGRDVKELPMADQELIPFDIWTNIAHSKMLLKIGVLNSDEFKQILSGLKEIFQLYEQGKFQLDPSKEDVHINIEFFLTHTKSIEGGKKIHSGRSRNDQVTTDMRLYMRNHLIAFLENLQNLIQVFQKVSFQERSTFMPGFTHYQPAMWTSFGHWVCHWIEGLLRAFQRLFADLEGMNYSPLGAAAAFGTAWPIDREYTADLLGFRGVQENTLDCITSRGEFETQVASNLSILMNQFSIIAQDLILLSHPYYAMVKIDDAFVTGSSIMPQKRNPDFAEVIKSKASMTHGTLQSLLGIQKGSISGFNRDSQQTKYLIMDLFRETMDVPVILSGVLETLVIDREKMLELCSTGFMNSADVADHLCRKYDLSFRDAYNLLARAVKYSEPSHQLTSAAINQALNEIGSKVRVTEKEMEFLNSPQKLMKEKIHTGAPSIAGVDKMIQSQKEKLIRAVQLVDEMKTSIEKSWKSCFDLL